MILKFISVTLHNFGSYGHATLNLDNRGFCLVSGKNNYIKDNALSNGSGKSFLFSGICYALTGKTISGVSTNLKNLNIEEDSCYVTLELDVDKDNFIITRFVRPKSDLKIIKNGTDISGKGIVESKQVLASQLPDLSQELIASCILLGQGMPNKLSSFSPSGRKELLENLTKSDFMIDDIKTRLAERQNTVNLQLRQYEDSLLLDTNTASRLQADISNISDTLQTLKKPDFESELLEANNLLQSYQADLSKVSSLENTLTADYEVLNNKLLDLSDAKNSESSSELQAYLAKQQELTLKKSAVKFEIDKINSEIFAKKNIKDICPTCGQKIPGVVLQDTTDLEAKLVDLQASVSDININLQNCNDKHATYLAEISTKYDSELTKIKQSIADNKSNLQSVKTNITSLQQTISDKQAAIIAIQNKQATWDKYVEDINTKKLNLEAEYHKLDNLITITQSAKDELTDHLDVLKKIDSLVKRDFRGYLLEDIIAFLNGKAKEYCSIVFDTTELDIYLSGNNLDITYCSKPLESLSGGERQRVDLILQFAIRDLLSTYMNYSSNIIVLDEIFDTLDSIATDKILSLISYKLKDIDSIFIISHHADTLNIGYDSELNIIKDENGISTVYE